jgi:hypothetical protein
MADGGRLARATPHGTYTASLGYLVFAGCTATALRVTARFFDTAGAETASRSADLPIGPPPCAGHPGGAGRSGAVGESQPHQKAVAMMA